MTTTTTEVSREDKIRDGFDYHKAVFGFRPRLMTQHDNWEDECVAAYDAASERMKAIKATKAGRNSLRDGGWQLEGDPSAEYRE